MTTFSEDERLFRDSVYEFADREIRPIVPEMDEHAKIPWDLIQRLFQLGVMAIEIPDSRLTNFITAGAAQLIADNACGREFIAGSPAQADWRSIDLAKHAVHARVGDRYTRDGLGANVLGDPRMALTWLVNELSALDITLNAGEIITTGTCMAPLAVDSGDEVTIDFGVLGALSARFA